MSIFQARNPQPIGSRGSLKWLQQLVSKHADTLTASVRTASRRPAEWTATWVSPLEDDEWAEYRDAAFLARTGHGQLIRALEAFWPAGGPQWDALAVTSNGGVILAEAKAHLPELTSSCGAAGYSREKIESSLNGAKEYFRASRDANWLEPYYQYANRLAHLKFFCERGIDANLVFVYFCGDNELNGPHSADDWRRGLQSVYDYMGLPVDLSEYGVINLFISVAALTPANCLKIHV